MHFKFSSTSEHRGAVIAATRRGLSPSRSWITKSIVLRNACVMVCSLLFLNAGLSAQTIKIAGTGSAVGQRELLLIEIRKNEPKALLAPVEAVGSGGAKALASGAYPLHKQLFVVWGKTEPAPTVRRFVAFLATPPAKSIWERTGHLAPPFADK